MKISTRKVYSCEYCTATYLDEKQCNKHENCCESKPAVCPKVTYVKHEKNPSNLIDEFFKIDQKEKSEFYKYTCWLLFELNRSGKVMSHDIGMSINLNPKSKDLFLSNDKFTFDEYFAYWQCYGSSINNESFNTDKIILRQFFSYRSNWRTNNNKLVPNILELDKFDFSKYTLDIIYSDGKIISFDDFTHNNQWGRWCQIELISGNDIVEIKIIEKYLNPEKLNFEILFNRCVTQCPYIEENKLGSDSCRKCKHCVKINRSKENNIECNYKQDTGILKTY